MTQKLTPETVDRRDPAGPPRRCDPVEVEDAPSTDAAMFKPACPHAPAKVCVVAEIGVNHDGDVGKALALVDAAARAGADAVKLQLFNPEHLLSNQAHLAEYQKTSNDDVYAMLRKLSLGLDDMRAVKVAAHKAQMYFVVTPFSLEDNDALRALDPDAVKIASPDAVNRPLLEMAASLGRPMLVSTGTCELDELRFVADLLRDRPPNAACLLQCVSSYPTPAQDAALGGVRALADCFGLPVGYSDHTTDLTVGALAVAAGACVIEKHLTYDRQAQGPDHAASLDPENFAAYTRLAKQAAQLVGPITKAPHRVEAEVRRVSRQSICIKHDLPAGHVLEQNDLTVKRPGTGIPAAKLPDLVGRRLQHDVHANDLLQERDVA